MSKEKPLKLFTIGDSLSQGVMSFSAAKPEKAFNTLIANLMDIEDYSYLKWEEGKRLPLDVESIMRQLMKKHGNDLKYRHLVPMFLKILSEVDKTEDYFERGPGGIVEKVDTNREWFHNLAVSGMEVAEAFNVTSSFCKEVVRKSSKGEDNFFQAPNQSFYRIARRVLNPQNKPDYDDYTALDWLGHHARTKGVENVILWLGANNALKTIVEMKVKPSNFKGSRDHWHMSKDEKACNLWHPDDFQADYEELMTRIKSAMKDNVCKDWKIFVATVPLLTICPLAKGMGEKRHVIEPGVNQEKRKALYYQYYTYFPLALDRAKALDLILPFSDALFVDRTIQKYNQIIRSLVEKSNGEGDKRFYLVDTCRMLGDAAWKRNYGTPYYDFPDYVNYRYPPVNTKMYHADRQGNLKKGGLFSLDGVHPSAIGQGIIAREFLKVMTQEAKLTINKTLDWAKIYESDSLYCQPISLMEDIYEHEDLIFNLIKLID